MLCALYFLIFFFLRGYWLICESKFSIIFFSSKKKLFLATVLLRSKISLVIYWDNILCFNISLGQSKMNKKRSRPIFNFSTIIRTHKNWISNPTLNKINLLMKIKVFRAAWKVKFLLNHNSRDRQKKWISISNQSNRSEKLFVLILIIISILKFW